MVVILVLVLVEVILGPILVVGVTLHRLRPIERLLGRPVDGVAEEEEELNTHLLAEEAEPVGLEEVLEAVLRREWLILVH